MIFKGSAGQNAGHASIASSAGRCVGLPGEMRGLGASSFMALYSATPNGPSASPIAQVIGGAGVPSDQWVTGTIKTLNASGEVWNCGLSIGGAPGRSAPQVAPAARGK